VKELIAICLVSNRTHQSGATRFVQANAWLVVLLWLLSALDAAHCGLFNVAAVRLRMSRTFDRQALSKSLLQRCLLTLDPQAAATHTSDMLRRRPKQRHYCKLGETSSLIQEMVL
jgi:hypothetical protein